MKDTAFSSARLLALYDRISDAKDAIPRLRRFVLELAVRGKLVEQDSGDEPAAELLKRIAKEKARLVKAGEIKEAKQISLPKNVDISVPAGWKVVPLGEVINSHLGGGTPSKNNHTYWGGNIRWASVKDVGKTKYLDETIDRITEEGLANSSSNLIPAGNLIVVTRMGLGQLSINRVTVAINQDLRALFLSPFLDINFIYNFFLTYRMEGTGLTVKGIRLDELLGIPFPLPPLAEQHRIVAKVEELMALCDQMEQARAGREAVRDRLTTASLARLTAPETGAETFQSHARFALQSLPTLTTRPDQIKNLRQAILNLAVRGKLVVQDASDEPAEELLVRLENLRSQLIAKKVLRKNRDLPPVNDEEIEWCLPTGWIFSRLGVIFDVRDGTHDTPKYVDDGFPLITSKNLSSGSLSFDDVKLISEGAHFQISQRSKVERDDILLAMIGSIGNPVIVDSDREFSIKNVALFKYLDRSQSCPNYLRYFLVYAAGEMKDLASGGLQPFVSLGFLRNYPFPLPPLAEQHRIVAKVDALMALCDQLEASLTTTAITRSKLLNALLHEALEPVAETADA